VIKQIEFNETLEVLNVDAAHAQQHYVFYTSAN